MRSTLRSVLVSVTVAVTLLLAPVSISQGPEPPPITTVELGSVEFGPNKIRISHNGHVVGIDREESEPFPFLWTPAGGRVDLDPPAQSLLVYEVNSLDAFVGGYGSPEGGWHAYFWPAGGSLIDLGHLGCGDSNPQALNDAGQVVGTSCTSSGEGHGFFWPGTSGEMLDLQPLPGGTWSAAFALTEAPAVVWGAADDIAGNIHGCRWTPPSGACYDLGVIGTAAEAVEVRGCNRSGQCFGTLSDSGGERQGFVWTPGDGRTVLPTLGGSSFDPTFLNSHGQVAGMATTDTEQLVGFFWSPEGGTQAILPLEGGPFVDWVTALSDGGHVVGSSLSADGPPQAFIWTSELGTVPLAPDEFISYAFDVNNQGQAVGTARGLGFLWSLPTANTSPVVQSVIVPLEPVVVGTVVQIHASFEDPDAGDTHTAVWDWGDQTVEGGTVDDVGQTVAGIHAYETPGIYEAAVTVTDSHGESGSGTASAFIVVYAPDGGFVTGGGWIDSPEGAYIPDPSLTGKANFGFVSKYKKGATIPTGQTEFQFKVADLNFHSDSYDWLVVAGARAQFKGTGTINGSGEYKFMLKALDAAINEDDAFDVDRFRIKIWEEDTFGSESVIYDNGLGADDDNAMTEIGGGSVVIHKAK